MNKQIVLCFASITLVLMTACSDQQTSPAAEMSRDEKNQTLEQGNRVQNIQGRGISYAVHGSGPVCMVLPNSWGVDIAALRGLFSGLEKHLTLVYFDPRGMGASAPAETAADLSMAAIRKDALALLDHLGLPSTHFIGWSNGGMNLFILAAEHPQQVRSAVFVHSFAAFRDSYFSAENDPWMEEQNQAQEGSMTILRNMLAEFSEDMPEDEEAALNRRYTDFSTNSFFPLGTSDPDRLRRLLRDAWADTTFSMRHSAYSDPERAGGWDVSDRLTEITVPVLMFFGADDIPRPSVGRQLHSPIPDARFVELEHSGHFGMLQEPELFQRTVTAFITDIDAPR